MNYSSILIRAQALIDDIPPMLKLASYVIDLPMCSIINSSVAPGSYPSVWKRALVKPPQKVVTVIPSQTIGHFHSFRWSESRCTHTSTHMNFCPRQSGFCSGYFTPTTLLHVTNKWHTAADQGLLVGAVSWMSPRHLTV